MVNLLPDGFVAGYTIQLLKGVPAIALLGTLFVSSVVADGAHRASGATLCSGFRLAALKHPACVVCFQPQPPDAHLRIRMAVG